PLAGGQPANGEEDLPAGQAVQLFECLDVFLRLGGLWQAHAGVDNSYPAFRYACGKSQPFGGGAVDDDVIHSLEDGRPQPLVYLVLDGNVEPMQVSRRARTAEFADQPGNRSGKAAAGQNDLGLPAYGQPCCLEQRDKKKQRQWFERCLGDGHLFWLQGCRAGWADYFYVGVLRQLISHMPVQAFHSAHQGGQVTGDDQDTGGGLHAGTTFLPAFIRPRVSTTSFALYTSAS